ncbi:MAG TPA: xanthine dehydrogenase family protein, partial [Terriglobales bacterium]|nr:xanthine dehydrogenase family protein [Terriglobales bacterium]
MIGASPRRAADQRYVRGSGRFLDDIAPAGTLHLGVVRSVHAHARIRGVDLAATRNVPGVLAAWAAADLAGLALTMPTVYGGSTKGRPWAIPVLAQDVVRYVGEPVAVVIADDRGRLADALETVAIDYDPLPALTSPAEAHHASTRLHAEWPDNAAIGVKGGVGDPEKALAGADLVVQERLRHARLAGVPIETRGVLAYPEGETLVVWSSTQSPYSLRDIVATALGLAAEEVRVLIPDVGGGFGPKGAIYPEEVLVAAAARRLARPVKWVESRRESFLAMGHDREQEHEIRVGFKRDGTIVGIDATFLADVGAYPAQGDGLTANTVNHLCAPYRVRDYRNSGTSIVTNKTFNAAYRAAGRPEATFVMERLVDIGARKLGLDPVEVRRRNLIRADEMPYKPGLTYKDGVPISYDPGDFPSAFEGLLTRFGYEAWRKRQAAERGGSTRIGIGVACYLQGTGLGPFESATVRVDPSGKVFVYIGVVAQG